MDPEIYMTICYGIGLILFFFLVCFLGLIIWALVDNYRYAKEIKRYARLQQDLKERHYNDR